MDFILDYIKFCSKEQSFGKAFVCKSLFDDMMKQSEKGESSSQYVCSLIESAEKIIGSSSLGSENGDIIFLAGGLTLYRGIKEITLVIDKGEKIDFSHEEAQKRLAKLGLKHMRIKLIDADTLVNFIKFTDSEFVSLIGSKYESSA